MMKYILLVRKQQLETVPVVVHGQQGRGGGCGPRDQEVPGVKFLRTGAKHASSFHSKKSHASQITGFCSNDGESGKSNWEKERERKRERRERELKK